MLQFSANLDFWLTYLTLFYHCAESISYLGCKGWGMVPKEIK